MDCQCCMGFKIDRNHMVPGGAGYNVDGTTIYIDKNLPTHFEGVPTDPFIVVHEMTEKSRRDMLHEKYGTAHHNAEAVERKMVEMAGLDWGMYQRFILGHIYKLHLEASMIPEDLQRTDTEGKFELVKNIRRLMAEGSMRADRARELAKSITVYE